MVDDRAADRPWRPLRRFQMHQQAGAGVDLDDAAALFLQRPADVARNDVDAGDIEADDPRRQRHRTGDFGMDFVGAIDRDIAVALDQYPLPGGYHAARRQPLALQVEQFDRVGRVADQLDLAEREILGRAAPRIIVDLRIAAAAAVHRLDDPRRPR